MKNGDFELKIGAPGGTRTHDPLLRRQMLYPAELPERFAHKRDICRDVRGIPKKENSRATQMKMPDAISLNGIDGAEA